MNVEFLLTRILNGQFRYSCPHAEPKGHKGQYRPHMKEFVWPKENLELGLLMPIVGPLQTVGECPKRDKDSSRHHGHRNSPRNHFRKQNIGKERDGRPSLNQKYGRIGPVGSVRDFPFHESPQNGAGPDGAFDRIPIGMGAQDKASQAGIRTGNPKENSGKIEFAGGLVRLFRLPAKGVEGARNYHDDFNSKAVQETGSKRIRGVVCRRCPQCLETKWECQEWWKKNGPPFVELSPQDWLVDVYSFGCLLLGRCRSRCTCTCTCRSR